MQPYCCPVCHGRGTVPHFFYGGGLQTWIGEPPQIECRSCHGTGIVWGGDDAGTPAANEPKPPVKPCPATVTATSIPNAVVSFAAMQGMIPAGHPSSSIDPRYPLVRAIGE